MKGFIAKAIIMLITFGFICFGITVTLIHMNKNENKKSDYDDNTISTNETNITATASVSQEKISSPKTNIPTLNLNGLYDENDLRIMVKNESYSNVNVKIPYIQGLKNKELEQKINQEMRDEIYQKLKEYENDGNVFIYFEPSEFASFSNVISISGLISSPQKTDYFAFNYELIHGNRLTIDDVLISKESLKSMIRESAYRSMVLDLAYNLQYNGMTDTYGDEPVSVDEDELFRRVLDFMNSDFVFSFDPGHITFVQKKRCNKSSYI